MWHPSLFRSTHSAYARAQGEEEEDAYDTCSPVDSLENVGIQTNDIKKLKEAGLFTVERVVMTSKRKLAAIKGISEEKALKIILASDKITGKTRQFRSAMKVKEERDMVRQACSFGCPSAHAAHTLAERKALHTLL